MTDQRKGGIAWADETWNPLRGCTRVSTGCENCYAEKMAARFCGPGQPYEGTINPATKRWSGKVRLVPERLMDPIRWARPRMVFVNSMSDLFHEDVPDEFIDQVFSIMARTPRHTFQVLTKRPERMLSYLLQDRRTEWADCAVKLCGKWDPRLLHGKINYGNAVLPNVWIGVTVENQQAADERIPLLLQMPVAAGWISMEPLLGPVDLRFTNGLVHGCDAADYLLDWVVVGGESGPNARPIHPEWVRSLRDQCAEVDVPFMFKQWGEWIPEFNAGELCAGTNRFKTGYKFHRFEDGTPMMAIGKKAAGRLLDDVLHDEYPKP